MLNANDLEQLKAKGISEKQIEEQLACFVKGFPFLEIAASASVEKGIMVISKEEQASYMDAWDAYLALTVLSDIFNNCAISRLLAPWAKQPKI